METGTSINRHARPRNKSADMTVVLYIPDELIVRGTCRRALKKYDKKREITTREKEPSERWRKQSLEVPSLDMPVFKIGRKPSVPLQHLLIIEQILEG